MARSSYLTNVPNYQIEILDNTLTKITEVLTPYPLDKRGTILRFSKELSDFGQCTFRISAYDSIWADFGDIVFPHQYHVRIKRNAQTIWQGAIIENTKRNRQFIEVVAAEYEWYLSKILVNRSSNNPATGQADAVFRIFNSGGMDTAVTAIMNETINTFRNGIVTTTTSGAQTPTTTLTVASTTGFLSPGAAFINGQSFFYTGTSGGNTFTGVTGFDGTTSFASGTAVVAVGDQGHLLAGLTLGTVENPNFPPNMVDNSGTSLKGAWTFSANLSLTYDFTSILTILKSFGIYSYADFYIDNNLTFNFKKFVGNDRHYDINFNFTKLNSNIIDYNLPRLGQRMVNSLYGIATDTTGKILNYNQRDEASIAKYGLLQGVAAYADIKDQGILDARIVAELPLVATPDEVNAIVVLDGTANYTLGMYDIGDIVTISVANNGINFNEIRRIVGITVNVNDTGKETTTIQSNIPLPFQYGSSVASTA